MNMPAFAGRTTKQWVDIETVKCGLLRATLERHSVGWSWGACLLIGAKIAPLPAPAPAGTVHRSVDRRHASASIYACGVSSYAHPYLSFQRNSTLQHYDAIEIIARGAENCACMFVIVKYPAKRPRWPPRISLRPDPSVNRAHHRGAGKGESVMRISH